MTNNTLFQTLLKNEQEAFDRVYLRQPRNGIWTEYTWAEVMRQARQVAGFLKHLKLKKGSHIAIISKNCAEWFIADFGIHLAGMVSVPLFANQHEESIHYVLEHAEVALVFIGKLDDYQITRDHIPKEYTTISFDYHLDLEVDFNWSEILRSAPLMELEEPELSDLYTIIYSSGTSGLPKGAMYTNQAIANYLMLIQEDLHRIRELPHYKLVSYLPLAHVYERSAIELSSVAIHCSVSFIESLTTFAENLSDIKPSFFTAVPRIWASFAQKIEKKLSPRLMNLLLKTPFVSSLIKHKIKSALGFDECTNFFSGASALPVSLIEFFNRLDMPIQEGYGQTENLAYATLALLHDRRIGYVGTPRLSVEIKKTPEGELVMNTPCLMLGYFKDKKATQASFTEDGWLKTGDLVDIDEHQRVKINGRISENYKNQTGEFVAPTPIEQKFNHELFSELCLMGQGLPTNVLLLGLKEKDPSKIDKKAMSTFLQDRLHRLNTGLMKYERVHHIIVVKDEWTTNNNLLTPTLKVKRRMAEQRYGELIQKTLQQKEFIVWEDDLV